MPKYSSFALCALFGALATFAISFCIPKEQSHAEAVDRDQNFVMVSTPVDGSTDAIFVLDLESGQLRGSVMNPRFGVFTNFYSHNIAGDFNLGGIDPQFTIVSGGMDLPNQSRRQQARGVLYVGEMITGAVVAYTFNFDNVNRKEPGASPLVKLDQFQWRATVN